MQRPFLLPALALISLIARASGQTPAPRAADLSTDGARCDDLDAMILVR